MSEAIHFDGENESNRVRGAIARQEPVGQRTFTPSQLVIAHSAGLYHWTPDGRRLADFTSGVLVANLGHNPTRWLTRLHRYMGWDVATVSPNEYSLAAPLTSYNAISTLEEQANRRLLESLRHSPHGSRMEQVLWAASGSEAVQKALWAALRFQPHKDILLATRDGFHGKKGLAGAVTGNEDSPERDPRVRFISFPKKECWDESTRWSATHLERYEKELERLATEHKGRINCLITEPYLGGGGSYHPHPEYLQLLVRFCRENQIIFLLDEVQSNFGRTGSMYAFETYGIEPDIVLLGKGMGNGVPANAAVGRRDVLSSLAYGEGSDTWSGHPLGCAATLATLDEFESQSVLQHACTVSMLLAEGLRRLKQMPLVAAVRGEGHVWGIELADHAGVSSRDVAVECVRRAYLGDEEGNAIHLLGPLAGNVLRISPPLTMTASEAEFWMGVLERIFALVERDLAQGTRRNSDVRNTVA